MYKANANDGSTRTQAGMWAERLVFLGLRCYSGKPPFPGRPIPIGPVYALVPRRISKVDAALPHPSLLTLAFQPWSVYFRLLFGPFWVSERLHAVEIFLTLAPRSPAQGTTV
eukprot:TRINITY_DN27720_c0_g1_i1.p1 TRINITY_DN27720_c0_g1~~TRINITY_DN27720_c0_g1_i1.p1  ORF type:complete len:112 (-),score=0.33 TRINITY_DN27720_c0_g1_i1:180-515(-)